MNIKSLIENEKLKGIIAVICACIMWYAPDQIDHIIELLLTALGIQKLVITKK